MSRYDRAVTLALKAITQKGGPIVFPGAGTPPVYNRATDTWSGGVAGSDVIGQAIQIPDNPERFAALNLAIVNPVTIMVAGSGLTITPLVGMPFVWGTRSYVIKDVESLAPDGVTNVLWTIIGQGSV